MWKMEKSHGPIEFRERDIGFRRILLVVGTVCTVKETMKPTILGGCYSDPRLHSLLKADRCSQGSSFAPPSCLEA